MEEKDMAAIRAAKKELRKALKQKLVTVEKDSVAAQCAHFVSSNSTPPKELIFCSLEDSQVTFRAAGISTC
jgi:hypothetical protein